MAVHFVGVRHHSPACARMVRRAIRDLRPVHVLVEGPADMNDRMGELLLDHELPIAVFTSLRDTGRQHASWSPFCAHSPEWVAITDGHAAGASVRFIDLPAWHDAFAGRANRYADAEVRYHDAVTRLCVEFGVDNVDVLWDHLVEMEDDNALPERLAAYFEGVRGDASTTAGDAAREAYMAEWVAAAAADAGDRHVVVVTGGFHRPALERALATGSPVNGWPAVPTFPDEATGGSYLIPFTFRRLDSFVGYQSGMPSPRYYELLWEHGAPAAADELVRTVAERLRQRKQTVSTADLIAAKAMAGGLARLRSRRVPSRTDVLDGLVSALVTDALEQPLPWTGRGQLAAGTHPVVVEMVAALAGDRVGRLHPDTPRPPLLADVERQLAEHSVAATGELVLDLADPADRERSRLLHRLRVLRIPGTDRLAGPLPGGDPEPREVWRLSAPDTRLPALIEASSYGATLDAAASAALAELAEESGSAPGLIAGVVFDSVLCGLDDLSAELLAGVLPAVTAVTELTGLGRLVSVALSLWRHDPLLGSRGADLLAAVVDAGVGRCLWLIEGVRGGPAPADEARIAAAVAVRDAALHAAPQLSLPRDAIVAVFERACSGDRPPDLRGAATGVCWVLGVERDTASIAAAVRLAGHPAVLGDFLAGLFAVAREHVVGDDALVAVLDETIGGLADDAFLMALPSLRLAFSWFPPRERDAVARQLLRRRGLDGPAAALTRTAVPADILAPALALDRRVEELVLRYGLVSPAVERA